MARTEARFFAATWTHDEDWRALEPDTKLLYMFLLAQPELRHCGIISLAPRLWARRIGWDQETLQSALKHARETRYVVVDDDTEELLVRTLIRNDGIWKQPKMLAVAIADAERAESAVLRAEIHAELCRLDIASLPAATTRGPVTAILRNLPDRIAPLHGQGPADPPPHGHADGPDETGEAPADPHAEGPRGKGSGNGGSIRGPLAPVPESLAPSPRPAGALVQHPLLTAVPDLPNEGEGDRSQEQAERDALVAEARAAHPRWGSASIVRALGAVAERPWPLVLVAARKCWADPETKHPGRLEHDGDWWLGSGPPVTRARMLTCDEHHIDYAEGGECRSCAADRKGVA